MRMMQLVKDFLLVVVKVVLRSHRKRLDHLHSLALDAMFAVESF